jgi:alkylhydroperoxidase/carboxymuconolactone decarboxylase family protein YurZ
MSMTDKLPSMAGKIAEQYPEVWLSAQGLGKACSEVGPIDGKTLRLVKLAFAIGALSEGAVHSHVRRELQEGISAEELRHVALLAMPTLGFPQGVRALSWIEDVAETTSR